MDQLVWQNEKKTSKVDASKNLVEIMVYYFHQIFERVHFGRLIFILSYKLVHENIW